MRAPAAVLCGRRRPRRRLPGAVDPLTVRFGIFGGSFDPVHVGHLIVGGEAVRALDLMHVRLIPVGHHPLKQEWQPAAAEHRLAMLHLAVAGDPRFIVDDRECRRPGPSYTVDTLRELRAETPDATLVLLVGSDAARDLSQWHEAESLSALATVVELTRPGVAPTRHEAVARTLEGPALDISATALRARVRRGESIRYFVPQAVADYIAEHHLYGNED